MPNSGVAPWNKGRTVGCRQEFTQEQACTIVSYLSICHSYHDLCLFMVGIDTMLRCGDLLHLKVKDIALSDGTIREEFVYRQEKTENGVYPTLTPKTRQACKEWIAQAGKRSDDYLFTRGKQDTSKPISDSVYRDLVKTWAEAIGLDPSQYSTHSLRRTKAVYLFRKMDVELHHISLLLGHKNQESTIRYLGLDIKQAQAKALKYDIFGSNPRNPTKTFDLFEGGADDEQYIEKIADRVAQKLFPRLKKLFGEK